MPATVFHSGEGVVNIAPRQRAKPLPRYGFLAINGAARQRPVRL
jgi:hypothetical protein